MSQTDIARDLEMHPRTVREWMDRGVIPADADSLLAARCLIAHYQRRASGHVGEDDDGNVLDLPAERAKLAKAQTETAELKNAELRGELIRVEEVRGEWSRRTLTWKERVRAIPAAATVHVPGFSKSMARALLQLLDQALVELADGGGAVVDTRRDRARKGARKGASLAREEQGQAAH